MFDYKFDSLHEQVPPLWESTHPLSVLESERTGISRNTPRRRLGSPRTGPKEIDERLDPNRNRWVVRPWIRFLETLPKPMGLQVGNIKISACNDHRNYQDEEITFGDVIRAEELIERAQHIANKIRKSNNLTTKTDQVDEDLSKAVKKLLE